MSLDLFAAFVSQYTLVDNDHPPFERVAPSEVQEHLWTYVEMFQPDAFPSLKTMRYDPAFEPEVDAMFESLAANPYEDAGVRTLGAARVLLERVTQTLIVLQANELAGETVFAAPAHLPDGVRAAASAMLWLHQSTLPFEPGTVDPPMRERH